MDEVIRIRYNNKIKLHNPVSIREHVCFLNCLVTLCDVIEIYYTRCAKKVSKYSKESHLSFNNFFLFENILINLLKQTNKPPILFCTTTFTESLCRARNHFVINIFILHDSYFNSKFNSEY